MRSTLLLALIFGLGCNKDPVETDTDADTEPPRFGNGRSNGDEAPAREADTVMEGSLEDGEVIDIAWAATGGMSCWPAGENENFNGAHWFTDAVQTSGNDLFVRATPAPDLDISIYLIQLEKGTTGLPPDLQTASVCESMADFTLNNNPGVAEVVHVSGWDTEYRVVVGIAGAGGAAAGEFQIELWQVPTE